MKIIGGIASGLFVTAAAFTIATAGHGDTTPAVSKASPAMSQTLQCEHRGPGHRAKHGGIEDDRYHRVRGQRVTCQDEDSQPYSEARDRDNHPDDRDRDRRRERSDRDSESDDGYQYHRRDTSVKPNMWALLS